MAIYFSAIINAVAVGGFILITKNSESMNESHVNFIHLMTGPEGNSEFCFPIISMFPETKSRETLRFEGNEIHCCPRDQSLSDLLYSKKA